MWTKELLPEGDPFRMVIRVSQIGIHIIRRFYLLVFGNKFDGVMSNFFSKCDPARVTAFQLPLQFRRLIHHSKRTYLNV